MIGNGIAGDGIGSPTPYANSSTAIIDDFVLADYMCSIVYQKTIIIITANRVLADVGCP